MSRNIRIIGTIGTVITGGTGHYLSAEVIVTSGRVMASTFNSTFAGAATGGGYSFDSNTNLTISGVHSGASYPIWLSVNGTISGTISGAGTAASAYGNDNVSASGLISGCNYALRGSSPQSMSGLINGCTIGSYQHMKLIVSGVVSNCKYGFQNGTKAVLSGRIIGCNYGFGPSGDLADEISGLIAGCFYAYCGSRGVLCKGAVLTQNYYDLAYVGAGSSGIYPCVTGYGASLLSGSKYYVYKIGGVGDTSFISSVMWDHRGRIGTTSGYKPNGEILAWTTSGTIVTDQVSPPAGYDCSYKIGFEQSNSPVYLDIPLWGKAGEAISVSVPIRQSIAGAMSDGPRIQIIDPGQVASSAAAILAHTDLSAPGDTNWHTATLSYTPTQNGALVLRVQVTHNSGNLWFNWTIASGASGGSSQRSYLGI